MLGIANPTESLRNTMQEPVRTPRAQTKRMYIRVR
jgi:hypothetical protein